MENYHPPSGSGFPQKPSAHVEATADESVSLDAGQVIDIWSPSSRNGHTSGGVQAHDGSLRVPYSGVYFVYCQLFFNPSPEIGRFYIKRNGEIILVSQSIKGTDTEGPVACNGCFPLNQGDVLHVELANPHRVWNGPGHCFFGLYMV